MGRASARKGATVPGGCPADRRTDRPAARRAAPSHWLVESSSDVPLVDYPTAYAYSCSVSQFHNVSVREPSRTSGTLGGVATSLARQRPGKRGKGRREQLGVR